MSYEFEMGKFGNMKEVNGGFGLRAPERSIDDRDMAFLNRVLRELDGEASYDLRNIVDLQREFGQDFQVKLLNGLFNYRDLALAEFTKIKSQRDFMMKANEELMNRIKKLEAENERLIMQKEKRDVHKAEKEAAERNKEALARDIMNQESGIEEQVIALHRNMLSQRKISDMLGISLSRVSSIIKNYYMQI